MGTVIIDVHATTIYLPKLHHKPKFEKFVEEIICFSKFELFVFASNKSTFLPHQTQILTI